MTVDTSEAEKLERFQALITRLQRYVRPLFAADGDRAHPLGSGFFVHAEGAYFFVTAGHVLTAIGKGTAAYPVAKHDFELLQGEWFIEASEHGDLGVLVWPGKPRLPDDAEVFDIVDIVKVAPDARDGVPLALGYPASRNKVSYSRPRITPTIVAIAGRPIEPEEYKSAGCIPDRQILLCIDPSRGRSLDPQKPVLPALNGMSGGPIFWLPPRAELAADARPALVGAVSRLDSSAKKYVVGERTDSIPVFLWKINLVLQHRAMQALAAGMAPPLR